LTIWHCVLNAGRINKNALLQTALQIATDRILSVIPTKNS